MTTGALKELRKKDGTADGCPDVHGRRLVPAATIYFKVDDTLVDIPDVGDIQHKVTASRAGVKPPEIASTVTGGERLAGHDHDRDSR